MIVTLVVGLVCAFVGSIPIAGPAAVLIVEQGLGGHGRSAFGLAVGTAISEAGYALLAFMGMTAALSELRWLIPASRIFGALLLVGIGLFFALRPSRHGETAAAPQVKRRRGRDGLWLGLVVSAVNPTLIVTWSAVVTVLHSMHALRMQPLDAFPFAIGVAAGVTGWFAVMLLIIRKLHARIPPRTMEKVVRVLGWALAAIGAGLVIRLAIAGLGS